MSAVQPITTQRLLLRAFEQDDAADVFEACSNPVLGKRAGWPPHQSLDDSRAYINEIVPLGYVWAICEKTDETVQKTSQNGNQSRIIGSIGLLADPMRPDESDVLLLGYWLAEPYWNRGYMTEAAQAVISWAWSQTHTRLITSSHFLINNASRRVIEKCGFFYTNTALWPSDDSDEPDQDAMWYELARPTSEFYEA